MNRAIPIRETTVNGIPYKVIQTYGPDRFIIVRKVNGEFGYAMFTTESEVNSAWSNLAGLLFGKTMPAPFNFLPLFSAFDDAEKVTGMPIKVNDTTVSASNPVPIKGNVTIDSPVPLPVSGAVSVGNTAQTPLNVTGNLTTTPAAITSAIISVTTPIVLNAWVTYGSQVCKQLTVFNNWNVAIEVRINGAGATLSVPSGQQVTFKGLTNANQISLRRQDLSLTPLGIGALWENW